jgi:hypothetical protein
MIPSHPNGQADLATESAPITISTVSVQDTPQGNGVYENTRHAELLLSACACKAAAFVETSDADRVESNSKNLYRCDAPIVIATEHEFVEESQVTTEAVLKQNDPPLKETAETACLRPGIDECSGSSAHPVFIFNDETGFEDCMIDNGLVTGLEPNRMSKAASKVHISHAAVMCAQGQDEFEEANSNHQNLEQECSPQRRSMKRCDVLLPALPSFMDLKRRQV